MSILLRNGFEDRSVTAGVDWDSVGTTQAISTTTIDSGVGTASINTSSTTALSYFYATIATAGTTNTLFQKARVQFPGSLANIARIMQFLNVGAAKVGIRTTSGATPVLQLWDEGASVQVQIGSNSATIPLGTFFTMELSCTDNTAGTATVEARLNGVVFAHGTLNNSAPQTITSVRIGNPQNLTNNIFFDNVAVNDSVGSANNSYPQDSRIFDMVPTGAGDVNTFATQVGGTAGSANNFSRVSETPPDDVTSYNASNTLNQEDMFTVTPPAVPRNSIINSVVVNIRLANITGADTFCAVKPQLKRRSNGTVSQGSAIAPNSTSWATNKGGTSIYPHPLILTADPDGNPWTVDSLAEIQIGYKVTTGGVNPVGVSKVWATVDYTPANVMRPTNNLRPHIFSPGLAR